MVKEIWVNIGTGNGLLPGGLWDNYDCLKLHQANVDFSFVRLFGIHMKKKKQCYSERPSYYSV